MTGATPLLARLAGKVDVYRFGRPLTQAMPSPSDSIAWVSGLPSAAMDELLLF
ncbi:MAG: F0F1 ATP synthase subunit alpha, partial [Methylococcus sp.]